MAKRTAKTLDPNKPFIVSFLSDYGFKVTFADKNNTLFARKAIELIIGETQPIKSLKYLRHEFQGKSVYDRSGLYDVLCQDEHLRVFIVEMQVEKYKDLLERLQYYTFHIFNSLVKKGKSGFEGMSSIHCICILKGKVTSSVKYHQVITLKNEDNEIVMDNIVFHLIELGKFPITKKEIDKIITEKEELLYTMKYAETFNPAKDKYPPFWEKEFIKGALKRLDTSRMSPIEAAAYENWLLREKIVENKKEQTLAAERKKAKREGKIEGKIEAVKKLLLRGKATIEEITEDIDVSIDFVKQIQDSLGKETQSENVPPKPKIKKSHNKNNKS